MSTLQTAPATSPVDVGQFIEALFRATRNRKLKWVRGPNTDEFLAAAASTTNKQSYVLRRLTTEDSERGFLAQQLHVETSNPETRELLFELEVPLSGMPLELYREVQLQSDKTAERLQESVKLLNSL